MEAIDIVYVLGKGSAWNNNELRLSLRSVSKNLKSIRKIYLVGEKPEWIKNIIHIPFGDELKNNADGNIIKKILRVCQEENLSDNFLFMNDDYLIMQAIEAPSIPPYHKGDMTTFEKAYFEDCFWKGRLWRTMNILVQKGFTAYHFDCHVPIVLNKKLFPEVIKQFDFERNIGYTMKSLYGNVIYPDGPLLNGEKVTMFRPYSLKDSIERMKDRQFIAFNDTGLTPVLKEILYNMFPSSSKYEKAGAVPAFEIISWLWDEEKDYEKGALLYEKYGKSLWTKNYFAKVESKVRNEKLIFKLREMLKYV